MFSINFPFTVTEVKGRRIFRSLQHENIDGKVTSDILALLELGELLNSSDVLQFTEPILDASKGDKNIWGLLTELMLAEDGCI